MKGVVIANGTINDYNLLNEITENSDFIICADGGARHLHKIRKVPTMIVGDLDSIDEDVILQYKDQGVRFEKFPPKKDYTDMELAINYAIEFKPNELTIMGAIGSRLDHTMANIYMLVDIMKKGISCRMLNNKNEIRVISDTIEIRCNDDLNVSLIPLTEKVEGICLTGFEYPLDNETLYMGQSRGVSNKLKSLIGNISIKNGLLAVIVSSD